MHRNTVTLNSCYMIPGTGIRITGYADDLHVIAP
jgi:hypothetical protein